MADDVCKEKVFKSIFYNYAEGMRNFLYYQSGNLAQAEDLVQEAFAKLWENCKKVPHEKAKSYLYTILRNKFLNEKAHEKVILKFEQRGHSERDGLTPEYLLEMEEFRNQLMQAIGNLPEKQRQVFLMSRMDKKKYAEIAEALGISVKAVEKRMHKALAALKKVHKKV